MIGERVRQIRTHLTINLSQEEFGRRINVKGNTISRWEAGERGVNDRTIADICRVYNVNEEWLRDGEGEMFTSEEDAILRQLADKHRLTGLDQAIIEQYLHLNDQHREVIRNMARRLAEYVAAHPEDKPAEAARHTIGKMSSEIAPELLPHIPGISPESLAEGIKIAQEIELEKNTPTSPALAAGGENEKKTSPD